MNYTYMVQCADGSLYTGWTNSLEMCIRDRSLSGVGVGYLRGAVLSTRGPGWTDLWCIG